jgi:hypothetical protein
MVLAVAGLMFGTTGQNVEATAGISKGGVEAGGGTTFPANGGTLGPIPDGAVGGTICGDYGAPRNVTFTVSGMSAPLTGVSVSMTGTHTWIGDLEVTLIASNGTWTLRVRDGGEGDVGSITAASLTLVVSSVSAGPAKDDFDGGGKSDFMTVRVISGAVRWSLLTRTGQQSYTVWGKTTDAGFTVFIAQSDYDGDGKTDIAVYRRNNTNADDCFYWVLRSSDGQIQTFEWGQPNDTPINGWDIN